MYVRTSKCEDLSQRFERVEQQHVISVKCPLKTDYFIAQWGKWPFLRQIKSSPFFTKIWMAILVKTLPPPIFFFYCCNFANYFFGASLGHSEHILLLVHNSADGRKKTHFYHRLSQLKKLRVPNVLCFFVSCFYSYEKWAGKFKATLTLNPPPMSHDDGWKKIHFWGPILS
jgi:hypothetical protein